VIIATWEAEIGRITIQHHPGKTFARPYLNNKKLCMVVCTCHPRSTGSINKRIMIQADQGINARPY
jgi:hypothetical protein